MIVNLILLFSLSCLAICQQPSLQNLQQFYQGLLNNLPISIKYIQIQSQLTDLTDESQSLQIVVQNFQQSDIKQGLSQLSELVETVSEAIQQYNPSSEDLQQLKLLISQLLNPLRFQYRQQPVKSLLINGVELQQDIDQLLSNYKARNFKKVGNCVGQISRQILAGYQVRKDMVNQISDEQLQQIFKGILEGVMSSVQYRQVQGCLVGLEQLTADLVIDGMDRLVEQGNKNKIREGLWMVGVLLKRLSDAMESCKVQLVDEIRSISDISIQLQFPVQFRYRANRDLIINGVQIYAEVGGCVTEYQDRKYEDMGGYIGNIVGLLLIGQTRKITIVEVKEIVQGLVQGFLHQQAVNKIMPCIQDLQDESDLIYQSVLNFLKKDLQNVKKAIGQLGQAMDSLPHAMEDCAVSVSEIDKIRKTFQQFKSPISFMYHVGKDLVINGVQIFEDIEQAVADYKLERFEEMGQNIGHAMSKLLIGDGVVVMGLEG